MLERFKSSDDEPVQRTGATATEAPPGDDPGTSDRGERMRRREEARGGGESARETARSRQRDEFGGINWGAS